MVDILKLLFILELFGVIGWPIAFRLFAPLPSRGYAFAKALALLLVLIGAAQPGPQEPGQVLHHLGSRHRALLDPPVSGGMGQPHDGVRPHLGDLR